MQGPRQRLRRKLAPQRAEGPSWRRGWHDRRRAGQVTSRRLLMPKAGIRLEPAGPVPGEVPGARIAGLLLAVAVTALAAVQFATDHPVTTLAWLAIAPLLASLVLPPRFTGLIAGWTVLLGLGGAARAGTGLQRSQPGQTVDRPARCLDPPGRIRGDQLSSAQRRLSQARAVARVAQSAILREVPQTAAAARLASRYQPASSDARVGGDVLEVVADGVQTRWFVATPRAKGCLQSAWPVSLPPASGTPACSRACRWPKSPGPSTCQCPGRQAKKTSSLRCLLNSTRAPGSSS
jgi:hypothetical protein